MNRTSLVSKAKRTLNKILVLIMFCFGVSAGLAGSDKPNLLVNGDFELGAELPDGWRFIGKDGALPQKQVDESVVYEQENGPVGKRALLLKEGGVQVGIRQNLEGEPSPEYEYKLSGYVKTENFSGKYVRLAVIDKGFSKFYAFIDVKNDNQDWTPVETTFKMPETSKGVSVVFYTSGEFSGKAWVDGIKLEQERKLTDAELAVATGDEKKNSLPSQK